MRDYENDLFNAEGFVRDQFLFRGVANADWHLVSSFDRCYTHVEWTLRQKVEEHLLAEFKRNCMRYIYQSGIEQLNPTQVKNLAQHYGVPTRMLDWSYSPFISAYFAFSRISNNPNVAIWALNTKHEIWNNDYGVKIEQDILTSNERQKRQLGCFTILHSSDPSLDSFVIHCGENGIDISDALIKLTIPATERKRVLLELDAMSINPSTIMGDMKGAPLPLLLKLSSSFYSMKANVNLVISQ